MVGGSFAGLWSRMAIRKRSFNWGPTIAEKNFDRTPHGVDTGMSHQRLRCRLEGDASAKKASTSRCWRGMNVLYERDRIRDVAWLLASRQAASCKGFAVIPVRPPTLPHSFRVCMFVSVGIVRLTALYDVLKVRRDFSLDGGRFMKQLTSASRM